MNLSIAVLSFALAVPVLCAPSAQANPKQLLSGTVIGVQEKEMQSPEVTGGSNPSDAQLASQFYAYDVFVRVDCKTYVARYQTPFDYLPSAFAAGQPIQLHLGKHVMYFDLPNNPQMRMAILRRTVGSGSACDAAR